MQGKVTSTRTLEAVRTDIAEAAETQAKIRLLLGRVLRTIKAARFKAEHPETGKRNPAFKAVRDYESTLRSVDRHLARLRAEEAAILQQAAPANDANPWSEFALKK